MASDPTSDLTQSLLQSLMLPKAQPEKRQSPLDMLLPAILGRVLGGGGPAANGGGMPGTDLGGIVGQISQQAQRIPTMGGVPGGLGRNLANQVGQLGTTAAATAAGAALPFIPGGNVLGALLTKPPRIPAPPGMGAGEMIRARMDFEKQFGRTLQGKALGEDPEWLAYLNNVWTTNPYGFKR